MSENFMKLTEKVRDLDEPEMQEVISEAERSINAPFFPQLLLVSYPSLKREIMETLRNLSGASDSAFADLENTENSFIVRIKYANEKDETEFIDGECAADIPDIDISWDALKNMQILWVCSSDMESISDAHVVNSDKLLFVTNATMAMTQDEKDWLGKVSEVVFTDEPITVSLCNKRLLNTQEEADELCTKLRKQTAGFGKNSSFNDDLGSALCSQFETIDIPQLKNRRESRIRLACVYALEDRLGRQAELSAVDIDRLNEATRKVEMEREHIEFSGKSLVNSTIVNMFDNMKNKVISAADRYCDDAFASIRERLAVTITVERDINNITPYLQSIWEYFEREIGKYLSREEEQMAGVLEQQIFSDCGKMVNIFEADYGRLIYYAPPGEVVNPFGEMDESKSEKNRAISKGMLIASIALAFCNPVLGLAGVVGTGAFSMSNTKNLDEAKAKVISALPHECFIMKGQVESIIDKAFEKAKTNSCENVWKVYSETLDHLMKDISVYKEQVGKAKERADILQSILNNEIPEAKKSLKSV